MLTFKCCLLRQLTSYWDILSLSVCNPTAFKCNNQMFLINKL
uniref:Uncharacterized protein n=1 Tax=Anguilla anguilla TaxID=7936 RepID=A0A0E9PKJ0_ANGAN